MEAEMEMEIEMGMVMEMEMEMEKNPGMLFRRRVAREYRVRNGIREACVRELTGAGLGFHKREEARSVWQRPGHRRQRSRTRQGTDNAKRSNETRFFCDTCGKSYKWKESLFKHKRVECGKLPQFTCEVCGYRFMHKHHLVKHLASIHRMTPLNGTAMLVFQ
ncbi:PREDICTED: zinc finger protein CKR1-like [Eufriesea mexicana]|uniref:zinc finger protein CKR1-like n=1 Tax=Eufriesea mexicana TaxID=516756 RepID=UPI00083BC291|nr:PREDICTED: zinc finger protein CKR1-like [Eufriesea mexicana]